MRMKRNVLIDGNNLLHRAWHVHVCNRDPQLSSPSGYPTGLIYGVLSMLSDWLPDISNPSGIYMFLDGVSKHRRALDPGYKAKDESDQLKVHSAPVRLSTGYEAKDDVDAIIHILSLLGVDTFHSPEHEADDLIASFIRSRPDDLHVVLSSDKDFYQLLTSDRVIMYRPGADERFVDSEKAEAHLARLYKLDPGSSVPPSRVRAFKALTGDPSDGISGVFRLRKKVAASAIRHCETSADLSSLLLGPLPGFSKMERDRAKESIQRIMLNYELVGLLDDVDVDRHRRPSSPDADMASRVLRKDLGIISVDPESFRTNTSVRVAPAVQSNPYQMPDWLQEI